MLCPMVFPYASSAFTTIGNSAHSMTRLVGVLISILSIGHGMILTTCCLVMHGESIVHHKCGQKSILSEVFPAGFLSLITISNT